MEIWKFEDEDEKKREGEEEEEEKEEEDEEKEEEEEEIEEEKEEEEEEEAVVYKSNEDSSSSKKRVCHRYQIVEDYLKFSCFCWTNHELKTWSLDFGSFGGQNLKKVKEVVCLALEQCPGDQAWWSQRADI